MAKQKLRKYELVYLVQPEASDEDRQKVADRVDHALQQFDAKVVRREDWGKRKLAYEIRKLNKAFYVYLVFVAPPGATQEVERVLRMLDDCVRFLTIKLEDGLDPDAEYKEEEPGRAARRPRLDMDEDAGFDEDEDDEEELDDA